MPSVRVGLPLSMALSLFDFSFSRIGSRCDDCLGSSQNVTMLVFSSATLLASAQLFVRQDR